MITVGELFARFPYITWRAPVPIQLEGDDHLGCRICIAQVGLKAEDVPKLPRTPDEFAVHMRTAHQLEPRVPEPVRSDSEATVWGALERERS